MRCHKLASAALVFAFTPVALAQGTRAAFPTDPSPSASPPASAAPPPSAAPSASAAPPPSAAPPASATPPAANPPAPVVPAEPEPAPGSSGSFDVPPAPLAPSPAPASPTPAPAAAPPPEEPPPSAAFSQPSDGEELFRTVRPSEPLWPPVLDEAHGWSGGVEAYGGLVGVFASDTREAFAVGGGLIRIRYRYYEIGGYYETSDRFQGDGFQSFGGFAGAFLPYLGWLDIELAAGLGARLYENSSARFGEGGYEVALPSLSARAGVSDRTGMGRLAARIGGFVVLAYDLGNENIPWRTERVTESGEVVPMTGVSNVGGFSASLYLTLGFDIGPEAPTPSRAASAR